MPNHVFALGFKGVDSEALNLALRDKVAISNGPAYTSASRKTSHVLVAMGLDEKMANSIVLQKWRHR